MDKITLFSDKRDCCACGACLNACPRSAISMCEDEYGFIYPRIDHEKCISCGVCKKVCAFQTSAIPETEPKVYAASINDGDMIMKSASGGMFAALALYVIENGGVVFGAELKKKNGGFAVKHTYIDNASNINRLQGSKYVQSSTGLAYKQVKGFLDSGITVLYSGTPCQIDGLNGFLRRQYENLITVDIICHGVPNLRLFNDYIRYYESRLGGEITGYSFRDKKYGQGMTQAFTVSQGSSERIVTRPGDTVSYIYEFQKGNTYRENCYGCKYACKTRISDITIGDYWGIYSEHNAELKKMKMSDERGISCLIANTQKGQEYFEHISSRLTYFASDIDRAARHNAQLNQPTGRTQKRDAIMEIYRTKGYEGFEKFYKGDNKMKLFHAVKHLVPKGLKHQLKRLKKG